MAIGDSEGQEVPREEHVKGEEMRTEPGAVGSAGAQGRTAGQEVAQGVFLIFGFMVKEECSWRNNSLQSA